MPKMLCLPVLILCTLFSYNEGRCNMFTINGLSQTVSFFRKGPQVFLAFIWSLSLACGALFTTFNIDILFPLLQVLPLCKASIIGLTAASLIPLILSSLLLKLSMSSLFYAVVFLDGFSGGVFLTATAVTFGSGAWLFYILFAFTRCILAVPRLYLYLCYASEQQKHRFGFLYCFLATVVVLLFEYVCVLPLIATLVF